MEFVTNKTLEKLKYDLVRDGLISYEDVEKADEIAGAQNINVGQVLINSNLIDEETLLKFLEAKLHIPYVDLDDYQLDINCLKYISFNDAQKYKIIPLFEIEKVLTVAMADPLDLFAIDKIIEKTNCSIEPVISSEASVFKKIDEYYKKTDNALETITTDGKQAKFDWTQQLHSENLSEEHLQELVRSILKQAILEDVHELFFEQVTQGLSVNFKKNFEISHAGDIPKILISSFVSKLKVLSNLDPSVSEIPQLGKLSFKVDETPLIASISAFPTIQGERISLKIYKPPKTLKELSLDGNKVNTIKNALSKAGIVLVCGSNMSGKTHIIYSILSEIASNNKNIMTIESITKYNLENVNQCELNENIGFNLDKAMRFIEFQEPDVIYFEGINTKEGLENFNALVFKNKALITEFLADNIEDLRKKLSSSGFAMFKSLLTCMIFIHNKNSIEIFDTTALKKFII